MSSNAFGGWTKVAAGLQMVTKSAAQQSAQSANKAAAQAAHHASDIMSSQSTRLQHHPTPILQRVSQQASAFVQQASPMFQQQVSPILQQVSPILQQVSPILQQVSPVLQQAAPVFQQATDQVNSALGQFERSTGVKLPVNQLPNPLDVAKMVTNNGSNYAVNNEMDDMSSNNMFNDAGAFDSPVSSDLNDMSSKASNDLGGTSYNSIGDTPLNNSVSGAFDSPYATGGSPKKSPLPPPPPPPSLQPHTTTNGIQPSTVLEPKLDPIADLTSSTKSAASSDISTAVTQELQEAQNSVSEIGINSLKNENSKSMSGDTTNKQPETTKSATSNTDPITKSVPDIQSKTNNRKEDLYTASPEPIPSTGTTTTTNVDNKNVITPPPPTSVVDKNSTDDAKSGSIEAGKKDDKSIATGKDTADNKVKVDMFDLENKTKTNSSSTSASLPPMSSSSSPSSSTSSTSTFTNESNNSINYGTTDGSDSSNLAGTAMSQEQPLRFREGRAVPATRVGRAFGFAQLGLGLAFGTASEGLSRMFNPSAKKGSPAVMNDGNADRLASTLCRMRGAALKMGQMLSIQDESLLPPPLVRALEQVRQGADAMPKYQLYKQLEKQLGASWRDKFVKFDETPFAAASIGQVHRATIKHNGDEKAVAVKVQYPGVANSIESDLRNLSTLVTWSGLVPKGLFIDNVMRVGQKELQAECDYIAEMRNQWRVRELVEADTVLQENKVFVPNVYEDWTTNEMITSDFCTGGTIDKAAKLSQDERNRIARTILHLTTKELFVWRFMQTDPNWGNFLYDVNTKKISLIDFGATREYTKKFVDGYLRIVCASANKDGQVLIDQSRRMNFLTGEENDIMMQAHVNSGYIVGEPFATDEPFDFRNYNINARMSEYSSVFLHHRLAPPPEEVYTLHRKLSGAYMLCIKLGAVIKCRDILRQAVSTHKFEDGLESPQI